MQLEFDRLHRRDWIAVSGGLLLAIATFLPWHGTSGNPKARIDGARGDFSAWQVHLIIRWLILVAAAAPLILAGGGVRDHELSWRGELMAVVAIAALGLVLHQGVVTRRASCAWRSACSSAGSSPCTGSC
jgi:hypothetical protein